MRYKYKLSQALETSFKPVRENGFYDPDSQRIIRALEYIVDENNRFIWYPNFSNQFRYAPFFIMGAMYWRDSLIGSKRYDEAIRSVLLTLLSEYSQNYPSYGSGPLLYAASKAYQVYRDPFFIKSAYKIYNNIKSKEIMHSEDSLLLLGLGEYSKQNPAAKKLLSSWLKTTLMHFQGPLFKFSNPTTFRHQNQMYTLWGICSAARVLPEYSEQVISVATEVLEYTITRRMRGDGSIRWYDPSFSERIFSLFPDVFYDSTFLYECHQTFFVNSIYLLSGLTHDEHYFEEAEKAMQWIFRTNSLNKDLTKVSGINVPIRILTTKGEYSVPGQMFKGAYEIGSYIMALSNIIQHKKQKG